MPPDRDNPPVPFVLSGEYGVADLYGETWTPGEDYPSRRHDDFPLDVVMPGTTLAQSKREGLFNGLRLCLDPTDAKVAACEPDRYFLTVDLFRGGWDFRRAEYRKRFPTEGRFLQFHYDRAFALMRRHPGRVWGTAFGERDSGCPWPNQCFRDKREAYGFWKHHFFNVPGGNQDPRRFFAYLKKRGIDLRKSSVMVHGAMLFSLHYYFDWGFPFVWLERGCGLSNVQAGIAFLRGAARQYGGKWGLDFSTHHPHRNQCTWYDARGRRRGGWSESLMQRSWMAGFLAGADMVHEETSDYTHWIFDPKGEHRLSPAGHAAKRFADFALREHCERGTPEVPVALLLNYYHGFDPRCSVVMKQPHVWGGKMPLTAADANIANFLELFFPGYNRSWGMFDQAFNPAVPWKSQWEYLAMLKRGRDMRPYEAGHLVESPFGDCLDVLVDTAGQSTLKNYRLIFLAGEQELAGEKAARLIRYVEGGGTLVASVNQLSEAMMDRWRIRPMRGDWEYDQTTLAATGQHFGGMRYAYQCLEIGKGKVLGFNRKNDALAWEIPAGKGRVILTAVPYSQDISGTRILPVYQHLFAQYIEAVVSAQARPARLQLTVNRGRNFVIVGAFNHSAKGWAGEITVHLKDAGRHSPRVREIWNQTPVRGARIKAAFTFTGRVPPFDFRIYRLEF